MKLSQLEVLLEEDLGWRKKELSALILIAKNTNEEVVLKSIILLLYAHWEGYIKISSKLYLKFISDSKKHLNELTENFRAVALKSLLAQCIATKDALTLQNEVTLLAKLSEADKIKFKIKVNIDSDDENSSFDVNNDFDKSIIDTNSNLSPKVFKNILSIIGLNYKSQIESKEKYINSHLLGNRNSIGHSGKFKKNSGDDFSLEINDVEKLRDIIFSIIDNFSEELVEYSKEELFLSSNQHKVAAFLQKKEEEMEAVFKSIDTKYE